VYKRTLSLRSGTSYTQKEGDSYAVKKLHFYLECIVIIMSSVGVFAQHGVGSITIQPKVGINVANLTKSDGDGIDNRIGFVIGAEAEYQIEEQISISAGLIYSQQGQKESGILGDKFVDGTLKLDYINIPILANIYVVKGLALKCGIQPGFKVNSKAKAKTVGASAEFDLPGAKSVDFSIPVGVSYEYANVQLDARYNWGLTKVSTIVDSKNSVFQITLGYKFKM